MQHPNTFISIVFLLALIGFIGTALVDMREGNEAEMPEEEVVPLDPTIAAHIEEKRDLIVLESPESHELIESPVELRGMARGMWYFEASFPVVVVDWDGKIIGEGYATAEDDWMTEEFVPFAATVTYEVPPDVPYRRGALILKKDNPSGLPEHDDALEIPVRFGEGIQSERARVDQVVDGDSIELDTGESVRLIGINAPEQDQPFYDEAKDLLSELVLGKEVSLVRDVEDRDQYGRLLRYVYSEGVLVNEVMVERGVATSYPFSPNTTKQMDIEKAEERAQEYGSGMWGTKESRFTVSYFTYDPPGADAERLMEECVGIQNVSDERIDLAGYRVRDAANHTYVFADQVLASGDAVSVCTGEGVNTAERVFWGNDEPIWNNDGDTLYMTDPRGSVVLRHVY